MINFDKKKKYLILVRQFSVIHGHCIPICYELQEGVDPLHMLGELYYRTIEMIEYAYIKEYSEKTIKYCKNNNVPIYNFYQKIL